MPSKPALKPIFAGVTVAIAGDLGRGWADVKVAEWVRLRKGQFAQDVDDSVTHLLSTPEELKKRTPKIKAALKLGKKACHIVSKDWLEDSISKKRRLRERPFLLQTLAGSKKKKKTGGAGQAKPGGLVDESLYHIYRDSTFFSYQVTLTRGDGGERYLLHLFESNAKPHLYWFAAKYFRKKGDKEPSSHRPSTTCQVLATEMAHFVDFFRKKTGVKWDERLVAKPASPPLFSYQPPTGGKPVGEIRDPKNIPAEEDEEGLEDLFGTAPAPDTASTTTATAAASFDAVATELDGNTAATAAAAAAAAAASFDAAAMDFVSDAAAATVAADATSSDAAAMDLDGDTLDGDTTNTTATTAVTSFDAATPPDPGGDATVCPMHTGSPETHEVEERA